jgi:hypothetical protein
MNDITLSGLISGAGEPALWSCPIQQGVPAFLNLAYTFLMWGAALGFFFGVLLAVYYYITAYGDESKAKKGLETFKWTFVGAAVVIISAVVVNSVVGILTTQGNKTYTGQDTAIVLYDQDGNKIEPTSNCTEKQQAKKPANATEVDPSVQEKSSVQAENELDIQTQLQDSGLTPDDSSIFDSTESSIQS